MERFCKLNRAHRVLFKNINKEYIEIDDCNARYFSIDQNDLDK